MLARTKRDCGNRPGFVKGGCRVRFTAQKPVSKDFRLNNIGILGFDHKNS